MGEQAELDWAQNDADEAEMSLRVALSQRLTRWRKKDESLDRGTWHGISEIANSVQRPKAEVREVLQALADAGTVERSDVSNGTFWRAATAVSNETKIDALVKALRRMVGGKCPECEGWGEVSHMGQMVRCRCHGKFKYIPNDEDRAAARAALATAEPTGVAASHIRAPESDAQSLETREVQS